MSESQKGARIYTYRLSDHTPQDNVMIAGAPHNGVYVIAGDPQQYFSRIHYSLTEGLLAYSKGAEHWERVP